jgi:biopolymer transport protein ExbB/TolQ
MNGILHAFEGGGFWMWPILAIFLICWSITIERFYFLYFSIREDKEGLLRALNNNLLRGDFQGAIRLLGTQNPGPLAKVLKAGLLKVHRPDIEVQAALDEASLRVVPTLEKRTGYLAVLSNAATLAGLLGTIIGMIKSFAAVAAADPGEKATLLAEGIAEAMNCTAFGLITAIPALLGYAVLQARTQHLIDDINECVVTELNLVLGNRALFAAAAEGAKASEGAQA